ncbi:hypothetical protein TNCV_3205991 [Trichonephila clavipes]|nr:hypothetical protein TNCV_3205991 [Trichonephila clavipes]
MASHPSLPPISLGADPRALQGYQIGEITILPMSHREISRKEPSKNLHEAIYKTSDTKIKPVQKSSVVCVNCDQRERENEFMCLSSSRWNCTRAVSGTL